MKNRNPVALRRFVDSEDPAEEDIPVGRDPVNDPPYLRYLLRRTFTFLPEDLDGVFNDSDVTDEEVVDLIDRVSEVFQEEEDRGLVEVPGDY